MFGQKHPGEQQQLQEMDSRAAAKAKEHPKEAKEKERPRVTSRTRTRWLGLLAPLLVLLELIFYLSDPSYTARSQVARALQASAPSNIMIALVKDQKDGTAKAVAWLGNDLGRWLIME